MLDRFLRLFRYITELRNESGGLFMKHQRFIRLLSTLACASVLSLQLASQPAQAQSEETVEFTYTDSYDPSVAVDWMSLLYDRIEAERISAPAASRFYAYAGVTVYEAVVPGMPNNYPLASTIDSMPEMPLLEEGQAYDWPTTANAALSTVLTGLFIDASPETYEAINDLRAEIQEEREGETNRQIVKTSMAYGDEVGNLLLEWISEDNFAETRTMEFETPEWMLTEEWLWQPTAENGRMVEPFWGQIRPIALSYSDECAVDNDMVFDTEEGSTFYQQAMEVKEVGDNLTEEQQNIARFWVDTPGVTGTPAGHWVLIENQLTEQLGLNLARSAEMYALVGIALGDSFISCWSLKYQQMLLRPETYIHNYIRRSWQPYIQTPMFPEYPSGHSVVSAAAGEVLTTMFGVVAFTDTSKVRHGEAPRSFTSIEAAATEAAISRLYGGIHYRNAIESGMRQGRCVGQRVLTQISLRPLPQGE